MFCAELRWIVRDGERILQQNCARDIAEWEIEATQIGERLIPLFEWRDVPIFLEVQEGDTIQMLCSKPTLWKGDSAKDL